MEFSSCAVVHKGETLGDLIRPRGLFTICLGRVSRLFPSGDFRFPASWVFLAGPSAVVIKAVERAVLSFSVGSPGYAFAALEAYANCQDELCLSAPVVFLADYCNQNERVVDVMAPREALAVAQGRKLERDYAVAA